MAAIFYALAFEGVQIVIFRRTHPELKMSYMQGEFGFPSLLDMFGYSNSKKGKPPKAKINQSTNTIQFSNGSNIMLRHCQHDQDVENYRGIEFHIIFLDEATHFTSYIYKTLRTCLRLGSWEPDYEKARKILPFAKKGFLPRMVSASNPGNKGHSFFKMSFIDPVTPMEIWKTPPEEGGMLRQFIPSNIYDNTVALQNDPEYVNRLLASGDANAKMLLEGDWSVVEGGALSDIWDTQKHVIKPFKIPRGWRITRSYDWGSAKPYAVVYTAESDGTDVIYPDETTKSYPRGTIFLIGELYGWTGEPNTGNNESSRSQGMKMREYEAAKGWTDIESGPGDTQIFEKNRAGIAESIHDQVVFGYNGYKDGQEVNMKQLKVKELFVPANKGPGSRVSGLEVFRNYLNASLAEPLEEKCLFVFENCRQIIRTLPPLPRDSSNFEDVDSDAEDHLYDAIRYRLVFKRKVYAPLDLKGI